MPLRDEELRFLQVATGIPVVEEVPPPQIMQPRPRQAKRPMATAAPSLPDPRATYAKMQSSPLANLLRNVVVVESRQPFAKVGRNFIPKEAFGEEGQKFLESAGGEFAQGIRVGNLSRDEMMQVLGWVREGGEADIAHLVRSGRLDPDLIRRALASPDITVDDKKAIFRAANKT